MTVFIAAPIGI